MLLQMYHLDIIQPVLWSLLKTYFRNKNICKWYFLILNTILHLLMLMNTWQFYLSNWQRVGPVWAIPISFVYTGFHVWAFLQSRKLNLTAWNLSCYLHFAFCLLVWLFKLNCTLYLSQYYDCFRGPYVIWSERI